MPSGPVNVIFDASATDTGAVKSSPIGRTGMHWPFAFVRWQLNFAVNAGRTLYAIAWSSRVATPSAVAMPRPQTSRISAS